MLQKTVILGAISAMLAGSGVFAAEITGPVKPIRWNPKAAATYLDQRQNWWESWPKSARDHGTVCLSCHTALPYALARPELRSVLRERDEAPSERTLIADVVTRVRAWTQVKPFYGDTTLNGRVKAIQSRGTEAVLNALVLASRDSREGVISPEARLAFANMFGLQQTAGAQAGAWQWLDFGLRPWESRTSVYFGAALAAVAIGEEPQGYRESPEIQPNLEMLRKYLRSHFDEPLWNRLRWREDPSLFNRTLLLWASAHLPGLLSMDERRAIEADLFATQDGSGAWRLTSLGHWREGKGVSSETLDDGYATGLIAYALEQVGTPASEPHLARALAWLAAHQDPTTGAWTASSLNKRRDPASNVGKFMTDAATAFAVLALTGVQH